MKNLKLGKQYEDLIYSLLHLSGVKITPYKTKKEQLKGENDKGLEIKYDSRHPETGNLYIEIMERTDENKPYVSSGIFRTDNTKYYFIGDQFTAWVFRKEDLQTIYAKLYMRYPTVENNTKTSKGFLFPDKEADILVVMGKAAKFDIEKLREALE